MYRYLLNGLITCLTLSGLLAMLGSPLCHGQAVIPGGQVVGTPTITPRRTATALKKWPVDPAWGGVSTVSAGEALSIASHGAGPIKQGDGAKYDLEKGGLGHVNMHSGAFVYPILDSRVPSHGVAFAHKRVWRSDINHNGPLGRGWDFWLDQKIIFEGSTVWAYHNGEGKKVSITRNASTGAGSSKRGDFYTIEVVNSTTLLLHGRYGMSATFVDLQGSGYRYRLTNMVDKNGIGLTLNYDSNQRLSTVVDSLAQVFTFSWYATGRIERIVDNIGRIVRYRYSANDRLIQVRTHTPTTGTTGISDPKSVGAVVTKYIYSPTDRLTSITLPGDFGNGGAKVLSLAYDNSVFPKVTQATLDGQAIGFSYTTNSSTPYTEVTDRNGNVDRYNIIADTTVIGGHIDYRNRSIVPGAPASVSTTNSTSPWGAALITNYSGSGMYRAKMFDYNSSDILARGNLMEERLDTTVGSDNSVWRFEYDAFNNVTSATDPRAFPNGNVPTLSNGHVNLSNPQVQSHTTFFEYDVRGNLTKKTTPSISTKANVFGGETSAPVVTVITNHNIYGVPLHVVVSQEGKTTKVIDLSYWPASDPTGSDTSSVPSSHPDDPIGFLAKIEISGQGDSIPGNGVKSPDHSVTVRYDHAGNRISEDDALGNTTYRTFNLLNQIKSETSPVPFSIKTTNTYDKNGHLTKSSTPNLDES
ncbi:MAG: YD repeat-containing protein, partial [Planctomycetota bacterium]